MERLTVERLQIVARDDDAMDAELRYIDRGVIPVHRLEDVMLIGLCLVLVLAHAAEDPARDGGFHPPERQIDDQHLVDFGCPAEVARLAHTAQEAAHAFFRGGPVDAPRYLPALHAALSLHKRMEAAIGALDDAHPFGDGHNPAAAGADQSLGLLPGACFRGRWSRFGCGGYGHGFR